MADHDLTIRDAHREIASLKELLEQRIKTLESTLNARLDAMDKALELAADQVQPILREVNSRLDDRLTFYQLDRAEILRRLKDIERLVRKANGE